MELLKTGDNFFKYNVTVVTKLTLAKINNHCPDKFLSMKTWIYLGHINVFKYKLVNLCFITNIIPTHTLCSLATECVIIKLYYVLVRVYGKV